MNLRILVDYQYAITNRLFFGDLFQIRYPSLVSLNGVVRETLNQSSKYPENTIYT